MHLGPLRRGAGIVETAAQGVGACPGVGDLLAQRRVINQLLDGAQAVGPLHIILAGERAKLWIKVAEILRQLVEAGEGGIESVSPIEISPVVERAATTTAILPVATVLRELAARLALPATLARLSRLLTAAGTGLTGLLTTGVLAVLREAARLLTALTTTLTRLLAATALSAGLLPRTVRIVLREITRLARLATLPPALARLLSLSLYTPLRTTLSKRARLITLTVRLARATLATLALTTGLLAGTVRIVLREITRLTALTGLAATLAGLLSGTAALARLLALPATGLAAVLGKLLAGRIALPRLALRPVLAGLTALAGRAVLREIAVGSLIAKIFRGAGLRTLSAGLARLPARAVGIILRERTGLIALGTRLPTGILATGLVAVFTWIVSSRLRALFAGPAVLGELLLTVGGRGGGILRGLLAAG